jgi:uncharacterized paraquat-inducible protein A
MTAQCDRCGTALHLAMVHPLASSRMYPLAALVFFASIAVPMLKLFGLTMMLVATADAAVGVATRSNET